MTTFDNSRDGVKCGYRERRPQAKRKVRQRLSEAMAMDGDTGLIEAAAEMKAERCLWCGDEFEPRRGGSPQRFCPPKYRDALYLARRRWAGRTVISGHLTVAELWGDPLEACMLRAGRERHAEDRRRASRRAVIEELALGTAQLASARPMVLEIPITAEGVLELCALRRVDPERLRDPVAAADAVVQLTNAAISLGLASTGLTR
jgi:hypothetical protein